MLSGWVPGAVSLLVISDLVNIIRKIKTYTVPQEMQIKVLYSLAYKVNMFISRIYK